MRIVVLSRNAGLYSTRRIVSECRRNGHDVIVVDHMRCELYTEKGRPFIFYDNRTLDHVDAYIPRIGSTATYFGEAVLRQIEMQEIYSTLSPEGLLHARNKYRCYQILAAKDILVPKTIYLNMSYNITRIIRQLGHPPYIVKLINSTHGEGVLKADSVRHAVNITEAFIKAKQRVLIQEFIAESRGSDIRVFVVGGKVVASMKRQAQGNDFRSNLHRGAKSFPVQLSEEEIDISLKAVKILGLEIAGVDLLRSDRGPMVLEVNASPGLEGIEGSSGVNIAGEIVNLIENRVRK